MPAAPNAYLKTKIMTASPAELRLMLIEGAIRFSRKALDGLLAKNYEDVYTGITRTQDILMELINALKPEHAPELCARLSSLYTYMYTQLMRASSERDADKVREVIKLLEYERETWSLAMKQLASEAEAAGSSVEPKRVPTSGTDPASQNGHSRTGSIIGSTVSIQG
jgi:flagellar protein FliS